MLAQVFVAAVAALPFLVQPALAVSCARTYTVVEGDYCDEISAAKNVSTYQLMVNNMGQINAECTNLMPGETLCLGYTGEDCTTTYVVKADDTCDTVATTIGTTAAQLMTNNPQIAQDCSNLYPGEVLCAANTTIVPAAPAGGYPVTGAPSSSSTASAAAPTNTDDDLPYCDEL